MILNKARIAAVVQTSFNEAAESFRNHSSAKNFNKLNCAMYAMQEVSNIKEAELIEKLKDVRAEQWANTLAYDAAEYMKALVANGSMEAKDLLPNLVKK